MNTVITIMQVCSEHLSFLGYNCRPSTNTALPFITIIGPELGPVCDILFFSDYCEFSTLAVFNNGRAYCKILYCDPAMLEQLEMTARRVQADYDAEWLYPDDRA